MGSEISLRDITKSDLEILYQQQLDREAVCMAAFPARDYDAFIKRWRKNIANESTILQVVIYQGAVAGNIASWKDSGERKVGYWFGKEYWGKGIATAGLELFLDLVSERPISAYVAEHNVASIRVLQKCGFKFSCQSKFTFEGKESLEHTMMLMGSPASACSPF